MAYTNIKKPTDYFNTVTYSGSETPQTITGVNFSADMAWFKNRTGTAAGGNIYDTVRGISDGWLYTNETAVSNNAGQPQITLNSDGYVLNTGYDLINDGASTYVSWNWLANGEGSANTDGSISSTVSANTTSGFSIVSYTGTGSNATVGHGLGSTPSVVMVKRRDGNSWWYVRHTGINITDGHVFLNTTSAASTQSTSIIGLSSSTFSLGTETSVNDSGGTFIAYCFAEKQGFSKFGSYTGNGSTDGTFVYTGFKPAFVMHKRIDSVSEWFMFDNKRLGYNSENYRLMANLSNAEADAGAYDLLSNGFKIGITSGNVNGSGASYIYMAFAEQPLVGDNPATAR